MPFRLGDSSVLCSINGPAEVKLRDEKLDKATIDVVVRPLVGTSGNWIMGKWVNG